MKTSLVVLAAGMGSRYGGLKQMDDVGPGGETILEYSVYDAILAGFDKIVFVIRHEFEEVFREKIVSKLPKHIEIELVDQSLDTALPAGYTGNHREKPRGTGHALLAASPFLHEPFAVISADDFYGQRSFLRMHDFLSNFVNKELFCAMGYVLENTISDFGTVNRGVCTVQDGFLQRVDEHLAIGTTDKGLRDGEGVAFSGKEIVSMVFFGYHQSYLQYLEQQFVEFLALYGRETRKEFYLPSSANEVIEKQLMQCKVLPTDEKWCGVTYKEDKPQVQRIIQELIEKGVYPESLWQTD